MFLPLLTEVYPMARIQDVDSFLYTFKKRIQDSGLIFYQRHKNLQALLDLEITAKRRTRIIRGLKPVDYYRGPREDQVVEGGEYWEFGKEVKGITVYIKLALDNDGGPACCYSFHPAERPIVYPFSEEKG